MECPIAICNMEKLDHKITFSSMLFKVLPGFPLLATLTFSVRDFVVISYRIYSQYRELVWMRLMVVGSF